VLEVVFNQLRFSQYRIPLKRGIVTQQITDQRVAVDPHLLPAEDLVVLVIVEVVRLHLLVGLEADEVKTCTLLEHFSTCAKHF
jgi:hypothetical protein